jgi:uncharacterized CHY-type Zn-finger protein
MLNNDRTGSTFTFKLRQRCERCHGRGHIMQLRCTVCGQAYSAATLEGDEELRCDHGLESYEESELVCGVCRGSGSLVRSVSKKDFETARRKRFRRGLVLFVLALVPVVVMTLAVITAEPGAVCGSWWYGVVLIVALFGAP